jgi:hypothetical protein
MLGQVLLWRLKVFLQTAESKASTRVLIQPRDNANSVVKVTCIASVSHSLVDSGSAFLQVQMTTVRLSERTSVDDVLAWDLAACSAFRVSKRSGFEAGAQGLALVALSAIPRGKNDLAIECEFEEPLSSDEVTETIFASAFGFSLARLAKRTLFVGTPASQAFKPLLSNAYKLGLGILGVGTSSSVICADPVFPLPPALTKKIGAEGGSDSVYFPPPSDFTAFLNNVVKAMGFRMLLRSNEEMGVVAFVYEALRNSWEHGIPADGVRRARSTRALIVEKLVLQPRDLDSRRLSPELKHYAVRIAEANKGDLGLGLVCLTVADQGDGIAQTLPPKSGETESERLIRAFSPGESRKPRGSVQRGLGLPKLVSAAHHLQALIRVTSGGFTIGQDFSLTSSKYPQLDFASVRKTPMTNGPGTAISIFVPEFDFNLDQAPLFGR